MPRLSTDDQQSSKRTKIVIIGECNLDSPRTLDAIRAILSEYSSGSEAVDRPLSIVLMGNFVSAASCAGSSVGGGSVEYKEYFDALASTLSEFPLLLANCTSYVRPWRQRPLAERIFRRCECGHPSRKYSGHLHQQGPSSNRDCEHGGWEERRRGRRAGDLGYQSSQTQPVRACG